MIEAMSNAHLILAWAAQKGMTVADIASAAGCSPSHLRNICALRKEASLGLAKRLSDLTGGEVPMDAFLRPEEASA